MDETMKFDADDMDLINYDGQVSDCPACGRAGWLNLEDNGEDDATYVYRWVCDECGYKGRRGADPLQALKRWNHSTVETYLPY